MRLCLLLLALLITACNRQSPSSPAIDPALASEIAGIKAIDNHAHPVRPTAAGEQPDDGYDALPVENLEAGTDPARLRPNGNPLIAKAGQALFNGHKPAAVKSWGTNYAATVLDRCGIERMVANRVFMGTGLPPERFLWSPYADALMYPFPTDSLALNSDRKAFFALESKLLNRYRAEAATPASTLADYLTNMITATLERHKQGGAVAEKFEMAYLRSLAVGNPTRDEAERAWRTASTNPVDYRTLQDYLFRYIATECGRLGMAVAIHTGMGSGSYYDTNGGNPTNLESLFNDPALRRTKFVMLHGGYPYSRQVVPLLTKPNAYVDISMQGLIQSPSMVAEMLRPWLEITPDKVLFGTDAYPMAPNAGMGWEETAWATAEANRQGLGLALTTMMNEGSASRERAVEIARLVLRENAIKLYSLH